MEEKRLLPENDQQELWERTGRMYATAQYLAYEKFLDRNVALRMLGFEPVEEEGSATETERIIRAGESLASFDQEEF